MSKDVMKKQAFELIQRYVDGWKQNNIQLITSCLTEDCAVIESHGPTYHGIHDIKRWFKLWLEAESTVVKWDIISFSFFENEKTAYYEWDFACISNNIKYSLYGISVVKFVDQKISFIHEYRMTQPAYEWKSDGLKSE